MNECYIQLWQHKDNHTCYLVKVDEDNTMLTAHGPMVYDKAYGIYSNDVEWRGDYTTADMLMQTANEYRII